MFEPVFLGQVRLAATAPVHLPGPPPGFNPATYKSDKPPRTQPPAADCIFVGQMAMEEAFGPVEDAAQGFIQAKWSVKPIALPPLNAEFDVWACPPPPAPAAAESGTPASGTTTPAPSAQPSTAPNTAVLVGSGIVAAGLVTVAALAGPRMTPVNIRKNGRLDFVRID